MGISNHNAGEQFARLFPNTIDGALHIERHINENSSHCLVHIGQLHYGENLLPALRQADAILYQEVLCAIQQSQASIYRVLVDIAQEKKLLRTFLVEALTAEFHGIARNIIQRVKAVKARERKNSKKGIETRKVISSIRDPIQHIIDRSSALRAYIEGKIDVLPGENRALNDRMSQWIKGNDMGSSDRTEQEIIFTDREMFVLQQAVSSKEGNVGVVFGNRHDWTNVIDSWNVDNAHARFSLVKVVPIGTENGLELIQKIKEALGI
jgi:hypothetical protein